MSQFPVSIPGMTPSTLTLSPRMLFTMDAMAGDFKDSGYAFCGNSTRDPDNSAVNVAECRPGLLLGKVSSATTGVGTGGVTPIVGLYAASVIGTLTAAYAAGGTLILSAASAAEAVRRVGTAGTLVITGAPTATGTVAQNNIVYTAINLTTGGVSLSAASTTVAYTAGSYIGALDGSATPSLVICGDLFPIRMTDINGTSQSIVPGRFIPLTMKPIYTTNIVNYPAAANTTLTAWLKSKLRTNVPGLTFDDDF